MPVVEEEGSTMSNHTILLHLSETDTTMTLTALERLTGQLVDRTRGTDLGLIADLSHHSKEQHHTMCLSLW